MDDNCEFKLFMKQNFETSSCDKRLINLKNDHFIQLRQSNTWLFSLAHPEHLTISCKYFKRDQDVVLSDIGSITINKNCKGIASTSILIPHQVNLNMTEVVQYVPPFNLINNCCEDILSNDEFKNRSKIKLDKIDGNTINIKDLNVASHKLENIIKFTEEIKDKEEFHSNLTRTSLITYLFSGIVVCLVIFKIYKTFWACCQPTIEIPVSKPTPRVRFDRSREEIATSFSRNNEN
jgi:hypothetical protein